MSGHRRFLRRVFTEKVGLWNRLVPAFGLFVVGMQQNVWVALICGLGWWFTAQLSLLDAFNRGWMDGTTWCQETSPGINMAMEDLLDLCQRHRIPPQEVAQLIWRDDQ